MTTAINGNLFPSRFHLTWSDIEMTLVAQLVEDGGSADVVVFVRSFSLLTSLGERRGDFN